MKKIISALAIVAMAFAVACGSQKSFASKNITEGDAKQIDSLSYSFGFVCGKTTPQQLPGLQFNWDELIEGLDDAMHASTENNATHDEAYKRLSTFFNEKYYPRMQEEYQKIMADTTIDPSQHQDMMKAINIFEDDKEATSISYDYGYDMGFNLVKARIPFQLYWLKKGINDGLKEDASDLQLAESQDFMRRAFTEVIPAKNLERSEKWLAEVEKEKGVKKTESGLLYLIEREGDVNNKPTAEDTVIAHYEGTLFDGAKFDSSYDRGEPATFPLNRVIPGWTEGLQLIGKGGKITLWIPSELAYGEQNMSIIQPNEALKFVVELEDVVKAEPEVVETEEVEVEE